MNATLQIRCVDGVLREILRPQRRAALLISRIKVMASLDIAESAFLRRSHGAAHWRTRYRRVSPLLSRTRRCTRPIKQASPTCTPAVARAASAGGMDSIACPHGIVYRYWTSVEKAPPYAAREPPEPASANITATSIRRSHRI